MTLYPIEQRVLEALKKGGPGQSKDVLKRLPDMCANSVRSTLSNLCRYGLAKKTSDFPATYEASDGR